MVILRKMDTIIDGMERIQRIDIDGEVIGFDGGNPTLERSDVILK